MSKAEEQGVKQDGQLFIVPTPIGNLGDWSERAVRTLKQVDHIAAEDTRHSRVLLQQFGINTPLLSLHAHNEARQAEAVIDGMRQGRSYALISDAGTPLISDPGQRLVDLVHQHHLPVVPLPGPCAAITALSAAGIATDTFQFFGFLPAKETHRVQALEALKEEQTTLVFYEAPHRLLSTLKSMVSVFGEARDACLCRELTKRFETVRRDRLSMLRAWVEDDPQQQRGECALVVAGVKKQKMKSTGLTKEDHALLSLLLSELPLKKASKLAAAWTGKAKNDFYQWGVMYQSETPPATD